LNPFQLYVEDELTDLSFANLVDIEQIRELLETHYKITGVCAGILDTDENILVAVGYHDICTRFHLAHPVAKLNCRESDAYIKAHLSECKDGYLDYRCKNGLVDVAVPIIIRGEHLATFFTGQFFYDDDKPDTEYFRKQAEKFGFDETGYLEALDRVPVFRRDRIHNIVQYYRNLVKIITAMGLKNLELRREAAERKRAEEERRKSEENFSIIFQSTPDLIAITRAGDGTILEVNEAFSRILGYSRAEAIGKCTEELSIWADPADRARWMAELEATGQVNEFETTLRCRDGSLITSVSTARPLYFGGEKCVLSVVRDISERKKAEEELLLAKFCIDHAFIGVYQISEEGNIRTVNEHACQSLGYTKEELCSMTVFDIDPTLSREVFIEHRRKVSESGSRTLDRTHRRKDGSTFPVEVTVSLLEFRGRKFTLSFVKDITERKKAEEELQLTQFCVDKASLALYQLTEEGDIWNVNECACQSLGYSMEELRSMSVFDIDPTATREVFNDLVSKMLACGSITFERIHRRKDGTTFPVEITANSLEFRGRKFAICFVKDITERKRAEEALRKVSDGLESRIKERTGQLTSLTAELSLAEERERRRIATELHDQVGQTLILSKIKLDSLSLSQPTEKFEKQIKEIRKYLDQSIQDIRSLTFQLSPPLLYEVGFEAAVEWLGEEFEGKYGLQVEFQDDGRKKPLAEEASVALFQMVRELLLNVAKHAKAKKVWISIGKASGKIKINVADDGSGFDGLNGMRDKNKKSSFGLFNIRHRIEYMGGEFKIKSRIDQGTSITLILPVKTETNSTNGKKP
jgi:PAS domain S-box-containing protein